MSNHIHGAQPTILSDVEQEILRHIRSLRFGAIEIQIHEGRIVQIERRERTRLPERSQQR